MARDTHRVMPHEDGWQVKRDGGKRASHVEGRGVLQLWNFGAVSGSEQERDRAGEGE